MSDDKQQKEVREIIQGLVDVAKTQNHPFNDWEIEFIENMEVKLQYSEIKLSPKQADKLMAIWDKV